MCDKLIEGMRDFCNEQEDWLKMRDEWIPFYRFKAEVPDRCVCGQQIIEMCEIQHIRSKKRLWVGNKCIDQFGATALCSSCNTYPLEKNTHAACSNCKRKETRPSGFVLCGKYKGRSYRDVFDKDRMYSSWVLEQNTFYDKHFREFLRRRYYELKGREYGEATLDNLFKK
jgi:hypothetical protein